MFYTSLVLILSEGWEGGGIWELVNIPTSFLFKTYNQSKDGIHMLLLIILLLWFSNID